MKILKYKKTNKDFVKYRKHINISFEACYYIVQYSLRLALRPLKVHPKDDV